MIQAMRKPGSPIDEQQEKLLIERAQAGCVDSRRRLVEMLLPFATFLASRYQPIIGDWEETFSLAQLKLLDCIDRIDSGKGRLSAYYKQAVYRACLSQRKGSAPTVALTIDIQAKPSEDLAANEERAMLRKHMRRLPKDQRGVLAQFVGGLTVTQIAQRGGTTNRRKINNLKTQAIQTLSRRMNKPPALRPADLAQVDGSLKRINAILDKALDYEPATYQRLLQLVRDSANVKLQSFKANFG